MNRIAKPLFISKMIRSVLSSESCVERIVSYHLRPYPQALFATNRVTVISFSSIDLSRGFNFIQVPLSRPRLLRQRWIKTTEKRLKYREQRRALRQVRWRHTFSFEIEQMTIILMYTF